MHLACCPHALHVHGPLQQVLSMPQHTACLGGPCGCDARNRRRDAAARPAVRGVGSLDEPRQAGIYSVDTYYNL
eukprot:9362144-Lingulodinium_polyedra.AAC.1